MTYFNPAPKQEAAAERLGMSFSAYRRQLAAGIDRLIDWLWQQEQIAQGLNASAEPSSSERAADAAPAGSPPARPPLPIVILPFERDGLAGVGFRETPGNAAASNAESAIAGEQRLFQSRRAAREGQRAQLRERIAQIGEEIRGLTAQQQSKDSEIKFIGEELSGVSQLYSKNLVNAARYVQLQRDAARLQGERGQLTADIAHSRGKIAESELQILQLDQDFRTGVLKELRETQAKVAELQERTAAAADELTRTGIRAPRAGIVYQLQARTVGGVIGKGETVMQIAPRADALIVEAKVAPQDIDQVAVGAAVHVRIGAGDRRTTPDLEARVTVVSPDLTRDAEATSKGPPRPQYYMVQVAFADRAINPVGDLRLLPCTPTEVYIRTGDRTALDFLLKPLHEQVARAFRER